MEPSQESQDKPGGLGVILDPKPATNTQKYRWVFTLNNHTSQEIDEILIFMKEEAKKYTFQEEMGDSGTPHLQGCLWLKKKLYLKDLKGMMNARAHYEGMKGTDEQARNYCRDEAKRHGDIWESGWIDKKNEYFSKIMELSLFPWQDTMNELLHSLPSDRKIFWVQSAAGTGKTNYCKYKILKDKWLYMKKAKYADIMNYVFKTDTETAPGIFIDLTMENEAHISYSALEAIKDGMIFNSKYDTGFKMIAPLHLVVFSNTLPDTAKLGADRWQVYKIVDKVLIEIDYL
ncbi:MAG: hypothetical protein H7836_17050 [Magnetococcus sp. YQC-3]